MEYMTVTEASTKWNISDRRIRVLCSEGRITGVIRVGRSYRIPLDAIKPVDGRSLKWKDILEKHQSLFARIDSKKVELNKQRQTNEEKLNHLQTLFLADFIYHSNAIAGNSLTCQETQLILQGNALAQKPFYEQLEVIGQRDAFDYITELVNEDTGLSESIIKDINSMLLMDKRSLRGTYRRVPVQVADAQNPLPEPYLIPMLMEWLVKGHLGEKGHMHIIEAMARFHMDFEGIHPFVEANGRTGRILLNYTLMQAGYPPISIKIEDQEKYNNAFSSYHLQKDADDMIYLLAEYMEAELDKYLHYLKEPYSSQ